MKKAIEHLRVLTMGTVFADHEGLPWIFVGYYTNKESTELHFVRLVYGEIRQYKAVHLDTLLAKFPSLIRFVRGPNES